MLAKALNSPSKRLTFLAALVSLAVTVTFLIVAPPRIVVSEQTEKYEQVQRRDDGNAWRLEKSCADDFLPKSNFAHEFWIAWGADSDRPKEPEGARLSASSAIAEVYVKRAEASASYYVQDADLTRVRERLVANLLRCIGTMCARSIDLDILDKILEKCSVRIFKTTGTAWHLRENPDHRGVLQFGLYISSSLFLLFLLLSVGYEYTVGKLVAWVGSGASHSK
jgi:hypothetical protein